MTHGDYRDLDDRDQALRSALINTNCVSVDPDRPVTFGIPKPEYAVYTDEFAYAVGPDHKLYMVDCEDIAPRNVDWDDAENVYCVMERNFGELFKFKAAYDDNMLKALQNLARIVTELSNMILRA